MGRTLRGVAPFVLGFGAVFVLFGALVGAAGSALDDWRTEVTQASGILVVAMGLVIAGALPLPSLPGLTGGERRPHSALLLGGAFALSWTPCVGPVLAAVLALASTRGGAAQAALLLGAYAAGLAVPLIASAVAFDRALGAASFLRDRYDGHPRRLGHRARRARAARVLRSHVVAVGGRQPRAARRRPGRLRTSRNDRLRSGRWPSSTSTAPSC